MLAAVLFMVLYAAILTLSPAVRLHSTDVNYRWEQWIGVGVWLLGFAFVQHQLVKYAPEHDPYLLPAVAFLCGWGLLTVWRLDTSFGLRQTIWLAISLVLVGVLLRFSNLLSFLRRYKYIWLVSGLALTALTFVFGVYPGGDGPRLWLGFLGVYLQPSEPLKLLLIAYLAAYLADRMPFKFRLLELLAPTLVMVGAALALLFAQRDLGTASLFIGLYALTIYIAAGKRRLLVVSALVILLAGFAGYQLFDVIRLRVDAWINPWVEASGRGFQIVQSLIAVASGGVFGQGVGLGSPGVVPVAQSDFVFSAIAEETGLIGSLGIVLLQGLIASRGLVIALRASNPYQRYLASGLTFYLVGQSILIIGGNLRLIPLTGVTLPFVSYGGSSLVTSIFSMLLLLVISSFAEDKIIFFKEVKPILTSGRMIILALVAVAVLAGWWGLPRSSDLVARVDNPRWAIEQRYVPRGKILDINNLPLAITTGSPGDYARQYLHPPLGPVIGYSSPTYGQAGLEAVLNPYLSGAEGYPDATHFFNNLLYAQDPPGLDVRLTLDLTIQKKVDSLLGDHSGAAVILNAHTGEILAMASHPYFDPNQLDENWNIYIKDSRGLFVDRVTQGQYPVGSALEPFLLAAYFQQGSLTGQPLNATATFNNQPWNCALPTASPFDWPTLIINGCPGAAVDLGQRLRSGQIFQLYDTLGFRTAPSTSLPSAAASNVTITDPVLAALGQVRVNVSPLQMALATAMLSNSGVRPSPRITSAVNIPDQGWSVLPLESPSGAVLNQASASANFLKTTDLPAWYVTATAQTANGLVSWFLGGTIPDWKGTPMALALVLEENNPRLVQQIGSNIMQFLLQP
jgi:cell division protein FtsW (lipid II flippase)